MDAERSDESSALDRAWEALDEGDSQAALELAAPLDPGLREVWILRASAHLEEGELREARQALEHAGSLSGPEESACRMSSGVRSRAGAAARSH